MTLQRYAIRFNQIIEIENYHGALPLYNAVMMPTDTGDHYRCADVDPELASLRLDLANANEARDQHLDDSNKLFLSLEAANATIILLQAQNETLNTKYGAAADRFLATSIKFSDAVDQVVSLRAKLSVAASDLRETRLAAQAEIHRLRERETLLEDKLDTALSEGANALEAALAQIDALQHLRGDNSRLITNNMCLRSDLERALSELAKLAEQLETEHENHKNTMGELEQTRDELADAKRDAERLRDSLEGIILYTGGADTPLDDEYVMDRAIAAIAQDSDRG